jgi:hypothetical protein
MKKLIVLLFIAFLNIGCEKNITEMVWCDHGRWGEAEWVEHELHILWRCSENDGYKCIWLDIQNDPPPKPNINN